MKLLLTGFEAFAGDLVNPSKEAVEQLDALPAGVEVKRRILPVVFGEAAKVLLEEIRAWEPDVVLSVGLAGGRNAVSVERIAVNLADARIPDNKGNQPVDEILSADGDPAYFATIPIKRIAAAIREAGIPAEVSNSAGLFVCNSVMYAALHAAKREYPQMQAGFVHLPYLPSQAAALPAGTPFLSIADDIRAIRIAVETIASRTIRKNRCLR